MTKEKFTSFSKFIAHQLSLLSKVETDFVAKSRIALGSVANILIKPIQIINGAYYFKLKKALNNPIYRGIVIRVRNKKFRVRDNTDLATLITNEHIDEYINDGGNVFLDVGAHVGRYSILYSDRYKKTFAFEPEPQNYQALLENLRLNGSEGRVVPYNSAVSDKNGELKFFLSKYSVTHSLLNTASLDKSQAKILVKAITLDKFIGEYRINPQDVSCVKIDVEGAEYSVLVGMIDILKCHRTKIIIEVWDANVENYNKIEKFLNALDFNISKISRDNYLVLPNH